MIYIYGDVVVLMARVPTGRISSSSNSSSSRGAEAIIAVEVGGGKGKR